MSLWFEILLSICIILITIKILDWGPTTSMTIWHRQGSGDYLDIRTKSK